MSCAIQCVWVWIELKIVSIFISIQVTQKREEKDRLEVFVKVSFTEAELSGWRSPLLLQQSMQTQTVPEDRRRESGRNSGKYLKKHQHFTISTNLSCRIREKWTYREYQSEEDVISCWKVHTKCVCSLCRCVYLKLQRVCDSMCSVQTMTQNLSLPWGAPCEDRSLSEERPSKLTFETKASHCRPQNKPSWSGR